MYKTTYDEGQKENLVYFKDVSTGYEHLICKIPGHYKYSEGIAQAIAKLLSEGKLKLDLTI